MRIIIKSYTFEAKRKIQNLLQKYLSSHGVAGYGPALNVCVDELIKNGIKGNYKYVLAQNSIQRVLGSGIDNPEMKLNNILNDRIAYNEYVTNGIDLKEVTHTVRTALTQESKVHDILERCRSESREINLNESETIKSFSEYSLVKSLVEKCKAHVEMRMNYAWDSLNIEISNSAPILDSDLIRIDEKRTEFRRHAERGEEHLFFINHIDEMDGGHGLGYAMIDSSLSGMGIDPSEALHIISISNTTVLMLLKINLLRKTA